MPDKFNLGSGSHEREFVKFLNYHNIEKKIIIHLVKEFISLKSERKIADYRDVVIGEKRAKYVLQKAKKQITLIESIK